MEFSEFDQVGASAAILSVTEVGLGSLLHGLKIPLSGQFLSLNQSFLLSRALKTQKGNAAGRTAPFSISMIAAILKTLSPAGPKLTPMLAISMQGLLYSIGSLLLGPGLLGAMLGSALLSPWALLQPVLIYWLLFGRAWIDALHTGFDKVQAILPFPHVSFEQFVLAIFVTRAVLAVAVALTAFALGDQAIAGYESKLWRLGRSKAVARQTTASTEKATSRIAAMGAARELLRPFFLFSLALSAVFFKYSESSHAPWVWAILRPLALGFILFFIIRRFSVQPWVERLARSRFKRFARSLDYAIQQIDPTRER